MSNVRRLARRGHNERFRLGAPRRDASAAAPVTRCANCRTTIPAQAPSGKAWDGHCYSCAVLLGLFTPPTRRAEPPSPKVQAIDAAAASGQLGLSFGARALPPDRMPTAATARSFGPAMDPAQDGHRVLTQLDHIRNVMLAHARGGRWRTLRELEDETGYPGSSISAQLRHLRKPAHGAHNVRKRRRESAGEGVWEYRIVQGVAQP